MKERDRERESGTSGRKEREGVTLGTENIRREMGPTITAVVGRIPIGIQSAALPQGRHDIAALPRIARTSY